VDFIRNGKKPEKAVVYVTPRLVISDE